jgi:hypothetical protein
MLPAHIEMGKIIRAVLSFDKITFLQPLGIEVIVFIVRRQECIGITQQGDSTIAEGFRPVPEIGINFFIRIPAPPQRRSAIFASATLPVL